MNVSKAYKVLHLDQGADLEAIKVARRKRSLETHPDRGGDKAEYLRVQAAYGILCERLKSWEVRLSELSCGRQRTSVSPGAPIVRDGVASASRDGRSVGASTGRTLASDPQVSDPCSNCGDRPTLAPTEYGAGRCCAVCDDLRNRVAMLRRELKRFDRAQVSALKTRLLGKRVGLGVADAGRATLGAIAALLTGRGALASMVWRETGLGRQSYSAQDILGQDDARLLAEHQALGAELERTSAAFAARNQAHIAGLQHAKALLAHEEQRVAIEAERQRELDRARRLLKQSEDGSP